MSRKYIYIKILSDIIFHSILLRKSIQYRKGSSYLTNKDYCQISHIKNLINALSEQDLI